MPAVRNGKSPPRKGLWIQSTPALKSWFPEWNEKSSLNWYFFWIVVWGVFVFDPRMRFGNVRVGPAPAGAP